MTKEQKFDQALILAAEALSNALGTGQDKTAETTETAETIGDEVYDKTIEQLAEFVLKLDELSPGFAGFYSDVIGQIGPKMCQQVAERALELVDSEEDQTNQLVHERHEYDHPRGKEQNPAMETIEFMSKSSLDTLYNITQELLDDHNENGTLTIHRENAVNQIFEKLDQVAMLIDYLK